MKIRLSDVSAKGLHKTQQNPVIPERNEVLLECTGVQMEAAGIEPVAVTALQDKDLGNMEKSGAAKSGALLDRRVVDDDLAVLVAAWPTLAKEVKLEILRMVHDGD